MKEVVIKRQEMLVLLHNHRYGLPDEQADLAIGRGIAELIAPDVVKQEEVEPEKKTKKGGK
jgi:hypothetical protein